MDGKELLYRLRQLLNEDSSSSFLDDKTTYSYLWDAAIEFATRSEALKSTQTITTVSGTSSYALNADFVRLYLKDGSGNYFIKYTNGTTDTFITFRSYENIIYDNLTTSVTTPQRFSIIDKPNLYSQVTGTATSTGASSGGQSVLTDTAANFSNVSAGDVIHNTTDGCDGYVLSKTSSTVLVTALFGGSGNDWAISDAYVIQPQGRLQIVLQQPPSASSDTITVEYVQRPDPIFSSYGVYRFMPQYSDAIVKYAAWMYKYRDREPDFGDAFYKNFERVSRMNQYNMNQSLRRVGMSVNLNKRL